MLVGASWSVQINDEKGWRKKHKTKTGNEEKSVKDLQKHKLSSGSC